MKALSLFLSHILLWHSILFAQTASSQLVHDKRIYDFGEIYEKDGRVSHTFIFTNTGKEPVIINGIHSGCGCTSTDYAKLPIKPGGNGRVTVTYNPAHRPGFFSKEVVVFFNNKKNYTRIWVKGTVVPFVRPIEEDHPYNFGQGLYTSLKVLPFGTVLKEASKEIALFYANNTAKEMDLSFRAEGNYPQLIFTDPGKLSANKRGKMIFKYTASSTKVGNLTFNVYPYVNGKRLSTPIVVKATVVN